MLTSEPTFSSDNLFPLESSIDTSEIVINLSGVLVREEFASQ